MARSPTPPTNGSGGALTSSVDDMLIAAMDRGDDSLETGRFLVTYKDGAGDEGAEALKSFGLRTADARDFADQAMSASDVGDAEALYLPEVGVAIVSSAAASERGLGAQGVDSMASDSMFAAEDRIATVEPEYFVFADQLAGEYLRGFKRAVDAISADYEHDEGEFDEDADMNVEVLGSTWGLTRCKVPPSARSGAGIRVAVLDTGMDLGHPDFAGRQFATQTFVGQPVHDLHSHGTHCIGTACGPRAPKGSTPRYGIGWRTPIFVGKVLSNSGSGSTGGVLAGMNWAIANRCPVISMSLGSSAPVQAAYTAAGQAALTKGCLIIAAAGNAGGPTGSPANSPTIMAVASLDQNLNPSSFSNHGKIEIAAPGRDVFSSVPRPTRYGVKSGTSMATPHVAGCAALWAETSPNLRGFALWRKLLATARPLPFPASRVGRGLVQAP